MRLPEIINIQTESVVSDESGGSDTVTWTTGRTTRAKIELTDVEESFDRKIRGTIRFDLTIRKQPDIALTRKNRIVWVNNSNTILKPGIVSGTDDSNRFITVEVSENIL